MALIEFKNLPDKNTPLKAQDLNHNFNELNDKIDLKGKSAIFLKTDSQVVPANTRATIVLNGTEFSDNDVFELQSDGSIKILKDVSKILCTATIRASASFLYIISSEEETPVVAMRTSKDVGLESSTTISGIVSVQKNSLISFAVFGTQEVTVTGHTNSWCKFNLTVLE